MKVDHIFIFTDNHGKVADRLVEFGWVEGSSRIHAGQGTTNRKFYFENFFLEVLWVHNPEELLSPLTKPTGLWKRANHQDNNTSPFGLCLVNTEDTDALFVNAYTYQPIYFPSGLGLDVIQQDNNRDLPWTFRLPFKGQQKNVTEPIIHPNGIRVLTNTLFEYQSQTDNSFVDHFTNEQSIHFENSTRNWLTLTFDDGITGRTTHFTELQLTIIY
ncbi:MAG: glyoxalase-like domain protein [Bacteroidetes bacterium]|nr:glyoxalase-like domain protein [Bacteroidota bacterium]